MNNMNLHHDASRVIPAASIHPNPTGTAMAEPRFDLYRNVHKGLRAALADTLLRLGAADPADTTALDLALDAVSGVLAMCRHHAEAENRFIHPAIAGDAADECTAAHAIHAAELAHLEEQVAALRDSVTATPAMLAALYADFGVFAAGNFLHMAEEETRLNPLLWAQHDDAALQAIQRAILQFLGPQVMQQFLRHMLPALAPAEQAGLLRGIRASAPPAGWQAIWTLARSVLGPDEIDRLAATLGETAAVDGELILLQIDFPFTGPWGGEMAAALRDLAESIAGSPGLRWKIWTENPQGGRAGGIYLFAGRAEARAYLDMHHARLTGFGIDGIRAELFTVNEMLSRIDRAPLAT